MTLEEALHRIVDLYLAEAEPLTEAGEQALTTGLTPAGPLADRLEVFHALGAISAACPVDELSSHRRTPVHAKWRTHHAIDWCSAAGCLKQTILGALESDEPDEVALARFASLCGEILSP